MTRLQSVLAVCCGSIWSLGVVCPGATAQTVSSPPEFGRLVERVMRDGVADTMSRDVAEGVGLGRLALPYKAIIGPEVDGTHRDVAVILLDGCSETRVDLCHEMVFGHVSAADYWALRASPSAQWTAGFVYKADSTRVERPMTRDDGERKLASEKAFWLAWLGR